MRGWIDHLKSSWYRAFSILFLMIFALQWISYTEPYWLKVTTASVLYTLLAVAVIEIIVPLRWGYRLMLEAVAAVLLVYRTVLHYGVYVPDPWLTTLRDRLPYIAAHMVPYLWFALGAAAVFLLGTWWVTTKARILMFTATNIVAFAALDSFTPAILWQEVAWAVAAAMGWLVIRHLRNFQLHYPRGWGHLLKYPFKIGVNVAIIFSLVIITGVNMPAVRPTLTDPYTAWREWNGSGIPGNISTAGNVSDTGTGTLSTARTASGYSTDDSNLGGGFNFDYSPVMTVTSDLRTYMRGETRIEYSGNGWSDDNTVTRGPYTNVQAGETLERSPAPKAQTRELQQTVKLLGNNDYPVLFGAYSITNVVSVDGEETSPALGWRTRDSELLWDADERNRTYPMTYVVASEVPVVPVQELSQQTYDQLYEDRDLEQYLQLPNDFPERVKALALEVTSEAENPYEKIALLQQYLQQTFPYSNQPDISKGKSKDLVERFLFEIMEGYCDYYSTALVTMARSLDIPARWVKGYAPGEQAELPDNLVQQGFVNNNYTITNADAHSWAEVYFGDYGWIPIEATPGFNVPLLTQSEEPLAEETEEPEEEETLPEQARADNGTTDGGMHVGVWAVIAAGAVLLLWTGYMLWQNRHAIRFLFRRLRNGRPLTPLQKVIAETERWVRYVRRKGMLKEEHETLRESVDRWSRERPAAAASLTALLRIFEQARYSPEIIEDKDWHSVYTEALQLKRSLRVRK
ncbi:transglutaminase-like domain-containing protein [Paenibacillus tengchongensis]|uniref:transglutaminase-like domain-containing protein n=1 Tax=Paenibacillus tengchongensis TaxID=2608684 RepID=UPI00124CAB5A|nr:transglutaminase-like domain-containing protein [Paenibacillus tengchongensis]